MATFDSEAYSRLWRDRLGRFQSVLASGREQLRQVTEDVSKRAMQQLIYSKPEDTAPSGRKLWVRTGDLLGHEHAILGAGGEVILTNDMDYAEPRHEAGKPGRRAINPARFAPWRDAIQGTLRKAQMGISEATLLQVIVQPESPGTSSGAAGEAGGGSTPAPAGGGAAPAPRVGAAARAATKAGRAAALRAGTSAHRRGQRAAAEPRGGEGGERESSPFARQRNRRRHARQARFPRRGR